MCNTKCIYANVYHLVTIVQMRTPRAAFKSFPGRRETQALAGNQFPLIFPYQNSN